MIGKLLGRDEVYAAMVLALSGYAMVEVAKGEGPLTFEHVVARVLPDPDAKAAAGARRPPLAEAPGRGGGRGAGGGGPVDEEAHKSGNPRAPPWHGLPQLPGGALTHTV